MKLVRIQVAPGADPKAEDACAVCGVVCVFAVGASGNLVPFEEDADGLAVLNFHRHDSGNCQRPGCRPHLWAEDFDPKLHKARRRYVCHLYSCPSLWSRRRSHAPAEYEIADFANLSPIALVASAVESASRVFEVKVPDLLAERVADVGRHVCNGCGCAEYAAQVRAADLLKPYLIHFYDGALYSPQSAVMACGVRAADVGGGQGHTWVIREDFKKAEKAERWQWCALCESTLPEEGS